MCPKEIQSNKIKCFEKKEETHVYERCVEIENSIIKNQSNTIGLKENNKVALIDSIFLMEME